ELRPCLGPGRLFGLCLRFGRFFWRDAGDPSWFSLVRSLLHGFGGCPALRGALGRSARLWTLRLASRGRRGALRRARAGFGRPRARPPAELGSGFRTARRRWRPWNFDRRQPVERARGG